MNIQLIAEQIGRIHLTLETTDAFEVYGGTWLGPFEVSQTGTAQWTLTVREQMVAAAPLRDYKIYARQLATGREWEVLSGKILVSARTAAVPADKLAPVEYFVTVPVVDNDVDTVGSTIVQGIPGPQGPQGPKGDPGEPGKDGANAELTPEAIQAVVPMAWGEYTTAPSVQDRYSYAFGSMAVAKVNSNAVGYNANAAAQSQSIGYGATTKSNSTAIGHLALSRANQNITIGAQYTEIFDDGSKVINYCKTEGTGSITIGAGANTLNNGDTESSNSVTIGCKAICNNWDSVVIGANAKAENGAASIQSAVVVGTRARVLGGGGNVAIGTEAKSAALDTSVGYKAWGTGGYSVVVGSNAINNGAQKTIAIGSNATITNTTAADGTVTKSENSTVIGYGSSASAPNAVVLGAEGSCSGSLSVAIGKGARVSADNCIAIRGSTTKAGSQAIGAASVAGGTTSTAIGHAATASADHSIAIGFNAKSGNVGTVVFASYDSANRNYKTQLYFSGAGTTLANTYEDGEAMMGYVVTDKEGNVVIDAEGNAMVGTQKLSVLFPNNRGENAFTPAMLSMDEAWTPKPMFHPADLDMPQEEPSEPEDVEITIPEPEVEEYTPLPVWPIVEPEDLPPHEEVEKS